MALKQITLFSHPGGPNPWKVAIILEELNIPYTTEFPEFSELHTPVYKKYNPNGRLPTIIDPNNQDFTLWESGAIIEYLVARYDPENKLHTPSGNDHFLEKQYLHFQMSGQGPYFGQAHHFAHLRPDISYGVERYQKEVVRLIGVLDVLLKDSDYLIGGRCSYADLAFVPWFWIMEEHKTPLGDAYRKALQDNERCRRWLERLGERASVRASKEQRAVTMKEKYG